jgi:hypothetical protein
MVEYLRSVCGEALVANICKENVIPMFGGRLRFHVQGGDKHGELSTFDEYKHYCQIDAKLLLELYEKVLEMMKAKSSKKCRAKGMFIIFCYLTNLSDFSISPSPKLL